MKPRQPQPIPMPPLPEALSEFDTFELPQLARRLWGLHRAFYSRIDELDNLARWLQTSPRPSDRQFGDSLLKVAKSFIEALQDLECSAGDCISWRLEEPEVPTPPAQPDEQADAKMKLTA